jgi:hypothetical protein
VNPVRLRRGGARRRGSFHACLAFRKWQSLRNPAAVTHCTPELLRALKELNRDEIVRDLGPYLDDDEIAGLMARRDLIVAKLESSGS